MRLARGLRVSVVSLLAVVASQLAPVTAAHAVSPPSAVITTPSTDHSPVTGVTSITGTGTVDPASGDTPQTLQLQVNGNPVGSAVACPTGVPNNCTVTFSYDFTDFTSQSYALSVAFTTDDSGSPVVVSPVVNVDVPSTPTITATVTSPVSPPTFVQGVTAITATGSIDAASSDSAVSMQLLVDGVLKGSPQPCTGSDPRQCAGSFSYDFTARDGGHNIAVRFVTTKKPSGTQFVDSPVDPVNATTAAPTAAISSPVAHAALSGVVSITAAGTIPGNESYTPTSLQLYVDGSPYGSPVACQAGVNPCAVPLSWDTTGNNGAHNLTVNFANSAGAVMSSPAVPVTVSSPPPTAAVVTPAFGSSVSGFTTITASGAIPASQTGTPTSLQLFLDNQPVGTPTACPGGQPDPKQCPVTFSYDFTGKTGSHSLSVRFVNSIVTVSSAIVAVIAASPAPSVAVVSPAASATVSGTVPVGLSGTVNPSQSDSGVSLQLLVDGVASGSPTACPAGGNPKACAVSVPWDTTGLTGTHVLQASFATAGVPATTSTGVTVTVSNPAPTATIVSPVAGATVSGVVTVSFAGAVNAMLTDTAKSATLALDGVVRGSPLACPASSDPRGCATSFSVNTVGLAGPHTLSVTFVTALGEQVVASEKVYVFSATRTTLSPIATVAVGHLTTVKGTVEATGTGFGLAGQPVQVTFTPAVGKKHTVVVHTDGRGHFATTYKLSGNAVVRAVLAGPAYYGVSSASRKAAVTVAVSCASAAVRHGATLAGSCKAAGLAKGVKLALQVKVGSHWVPVPLAKATAGTGKVSYAARFATAGTYAVRVVVVAGKLFAAGSGAPFTVAVG